MGSKRRIDNSRFKALLKEDDLKLLSIRRGQLAEKLYISKRQLQYYLSGKKPIPEDRLQDLCQLLDVTPGWLTGNEDAGEIHRLSAIEAKKQEEKRIQEQVDALALLKYLGLVGIYRTIQNSSDEKEPGQVHTHSIKGVALSEGEYLNYMDEIKCGIEYITDRYVKSLSRKRCQ